MALVGVAVTVAILDEIAVVPSSDMMAPLAPLMKNAWLCVLGAVDVKVT